MSKGDLLRAIYDDKNATWYVDSDHRIASRNFKTDSSGNTYVEYTDRNGIRLASAHEIHRYGEYPCVEFRNKDGDVKGHAYLNVNIVSDPSVSYYNYVGDQVNETFFSKSRLDSILEDYYWETGKAKAPSEAKTTTAAKTNTATTTAQTTQTSNEGGGSTGTGFSLQDISWLFWLIVYVAICAALTVFFGESVEAAWYRAYDIHRIVRGICLYVPAPLILFLQLFRFRVPKNAAASTKLFYITQLILGVAAAIATAWVLDQVLVVYGDPIGGLSGFWLYVQGYIPVAAYSLLSIIRVSFRKRGSENRSCCDALAKNMLNIASSVCTAAVFAARITMVFILKFPEIGAMYFFALVGWHILVAVIFGKFARGFYGD